MTTLPKPYADFTIRDPHRCTVFIQAPLPNCLNVLPILVTIEGRGRCLAGPPPSAPPEEPAND